jgi:hypothetical protein
MYACIFSCTHNKIAVSVFATTLVPAAVGLYTETAAAQDDSQAERNKSAKGRSKFIKTDSGLQYGQPILWVSVR